MPGGAFFGPKVSENPLDLLLFEIQYTGNITGRYVVFVSVRNEVQELIIEAKVEFLVCDREAICIRARGTAHDLIDHTQMSRDLIDLHFVEMGNGFNIHTAISIFHIKALYDLRLVRCSCNHVIILFSMMMEPDHPYSLLHVLTGRDLEPILS